MRVFELIYELQSAIAKHGDLQVVMSEYNRGYGGFFDIEPEMKDTEELGKVIELRCNGESTKEDAIHG